MSQLDEERVASALAAELGLQPTSGALQLGTWGIADGHWSVSGWRLILEVEGQQKHPTTNVAKLWPWLEERSGERVVLVHAFFSSSPALTSNRGRVAAWLGAKMERELAGRFYYAKVVVGNTTDLEKLRSLVSQLRGGDAIPTPASESDHSPR